MADKFVTLMIITQPAAKVSTIRFRKRTLQAAGVVILAFLSLTLFLAFHVTERGIRETRLAVLEERNRVLGEELAGLRQTLEAQRAQFDEHQVIEENLRVMANLEPIPRDVRRMGVGGSEGYSPAYTRVLTEGERTQLTSLSGQVDQLLRQTRLQRESLSEIELTLAGNREKWACVPSVPPVEAGYVSSGYGRRVDPFTGSRAMHCGVDFCCRAGTPVRATADGIVVESRSEVGLGRIVVIDHGNGYTTTYGHNRENLFKKGQFVKRGDIIARVGNSGRSTGPHLHYEVRLNGAPQNPMDFVLSTEFVAD